MLGFNGEQSPRNMMKKNLLIRALSCYTSRCFPAGSSKITPARNPQKKKSLRLCNPKLLISMAGPMGLEPTASGVTGRRYNRLNYDPAWSLVGGTGIEPMTFGL